MKNRFSKKPRTIDFWLVASIVFQLSMVFVHFGCGTLKTSTYREDIGEYIPQGEFSSPKELYESDRVIKTPTQLPEKDFSLLWPLKKLHINQGFVESGKKEHHGLDLRGRLGTPIYAAHPGTVIYAGSRFRGYGKMVIIEYNQKWATLYAHLNKLKVKNGDIVVAGQKIGTMGRTGRASGVHLHFELLHDKIPIDPIPFLARSDTVVRREPRR
jgi:murein DD-endopeptidase MepM/ murein hydrolase activator NlpD